MLSIVASVLARQSTKHTAKSENLQTFGHPVESKYNTPGTAGGPGGRDRTLAVKSQKSLENHLFFLGGKKITPKKYFFFCIYLLVMPKYWVKNYFAHGRFPEVGQKQKTEEKEERKRSESR